MANRERDRPLTGEDLLNLRKASGLSRQQLAELSGVATHTLRNTERYRLKCGREVAMRYLLGIAKAVDPKVVPLTMTPADLRALRAQERERRRQEQEHWEQLRREVEQSEPEYIPPTGPTIEPYARRDSFLPALSPWDEAVRASLESDIDEYRTHQRGRWGDRATPTVADLIRAGLPVAPTRPTRRRA